MSLDIQSFVSSLAGVLIGGLITWVVAQYFYKKASRDLDFATDKLRQLHNLTLRVIAEGGRVELVEDDRRYITGRYIDLKADPIQTQTRINTDLTVGALNHETQRH